MTNTARLTLNKLTVNTAEPRAKTALENAEKGMGFIPNMYACMANSPALLETYLSGYKLFRAEGGFTPAEQEVVFLTISRDNSCEYCMAAHGMLAENVSGVPAAVLAALRAGKPLPDAKLHALSNFTRIMLASRGTPSPEQLQTFLAAGYSERHVLNVILAIAVKTISNYSNHLFHTEVDGVFAGHR